MAKQNTVWTACGSCDRDTKHEILFSVVETEEEYHLDRAYRYFSDEYKIDVSQFQMHPTRIV